MEMPRRCPTSEEATALGAEVHVLFFGKRNRRYKIYFSIHDEAATVRVVHVRHWAMTLVAADELEDLMDESAESGGESEWIT